MNADDSSIAREHDDLGAPSPKADGPAGRGLAVRHANKPDEFLPASRPGASEQEFRDSMAILMAQTRN
jgi:hypothetical protein